MNYRLTRTATEKLWKIVNDDGTETGTVEQRATGFLVTVAETGEKIKRFRLIDALRQALGEEAGIDYSVAKDAKMS